MKQIILLSLCVLSLEAFASYPFEIKDPYLSSFWGYIAVGDQKVDHQRYPKDLAEFNYSDSFHNKVILKLNKQSTLSPLAVFIPGSFGATNRRQPRQITQMLLERGYHVLRIPNTLSKEYLEYRPKHQLGDFISSSKLVHRMIKDTYIKLQKDKLVKDEVTLIGVSHGAFISAVTANTNPTLYKNVLIYSPPINLRESMKVVDQTILENSDRINLPTVLNSLADVLRVLYFTPNEKELDQHRYKSVAKDLLTFGTFQSRLINSLKVYFEQNSIQYDFPSQWTALYSDEFWKWRSQVTFTPLVKQFAPKSWKEMITGKQSDLLYWSDKLDKAGVKVHILSAKNDFINLGLKWSSKPQYLHLLDHGGHYGYRYKEWFVKLFDGHLK